MEGAAERITDEDALRALAEVWEAKYDGDWRWEVRDGQFFELTDSAAAPRAAPRRSASCPPR